MTLIFFSDHCIIKAKLRSGSYLYCDDNIYSDDNNVKQLEPDNSVKNERSKHITNARN